MHANSTLYFLQRIAAPQPSPLTTRLRSHTHVYNPNWPPHARFHNGQTMSTGLACGLSSLYFLHKRPSLSSTPAYNLNIALFLIHLYFLPSLSGGLYPGARFMDPEFGEESDRPQIWGFGAILGISWVGWFCVRRGLGIGKRK